MKKVISTFVAAAFLAPQVAFAGSSINWNGDVLAGFRTQMAKRGRPLPRSNKKKQAGWGKARVDSMLARNPRKQSLAGSVIEFRIGSNGTSIRTYRTQPRYHRHGPGCGHRIAPLRNIPRWGWYRDRRGSLRYGPISRHPQRHWRNDRQRRNNRRDQRRGHDRNCRGHCRHR